MKPLSRLGLLAALLALMLSMQPANTILANPDTTIDRFQSTPDFSLTQNGVGSNTSSNSDASVLGGERDVQVVVTEGSGSLTLHVDRTDDSRFHHSQESGTKGTSMIQWDGSADGGALSVDTDGLGGQDLTVGGDDAFIIELISADLGVDATITLYSNVAGGGYCSSLTKALPQHLSSELSRVVVFPFAEFTQDATCLSGTADFADAGAITLFLDGTTNESSDVTFNLFMTGRLDYGDLPGDTFQDFANTVLSDDGAGHVVTNVLYLGASIDGEADGQEGLGADGDDANASSDEDGVVATPAVKWVPGTDGGSVDVLVHGDGCLVGWVDWWGTFVPGMGHFADYAFDDANEVIIDNVLVNDGAHTFTFDIPAEVNPANKEFYARFRLYPQDAGGGCTTAKTDGAQYLAGEVEDYQFGFGPLAVTLSHATASASDSLDMLPLGGALMLVLMLGSVAAIRRRR